jgi:hypothetical protein
MASCLPPTAAILAGVDLAHLRTTPFYAKLPPATASLMEQFHDARSLLAASNGNDLLVIAGGTFTAAPSGAILIAPTLALAGSAEAIAAADTRRKNGSPQPALLAPAESIAGGKDIWAVVRGDVTLPLSGNAANVNRLLRNMEFAAVTVRAGSPVEFALTARGRSPEAALHFEQTLRAILTMTAAAETKQPDLAALLRSIQVRREDRTVTAALSTTLDAASKLLDLTR